MILADLLAGRGPAPGSGRAAASGYTASRYHSWGPPVSSHRAGWDARAWRSSGSYLLKKRVELGWSRQGLAPPVQTFKIRKFYARLPLQHSVEIVRTNEQTRIKRFIICKT